MNGLRLRCLICLLAIPMASGLEGCGCGGRTTLPAVGTGGSHGTAKPDSGAGDGSTDGGAGGSAGAVSDGAPTDGAGTDARAAGGAGLGGAMMGGQGGWGAATGGAGGTATGGNGGAGAAGAGSVPTGGQGGGVAAAGGKGGKVGSSAGSGGGIVVTGGKDGGADTDGADRGVDAAGDAGDGATDVGSTDGTGATPLWRDSYQPYSQKIGGTYPLVASVWSDDRGVYVMAYDDASPPGIWANLGTGWQTTYTWRQGTDVASDPDRAGLKGFVDGALVPFGVLPCSIQLVDSQGAHCSGANESISDVATVGPNLAYAVYWDRILRFDGSMWTQLGDPLPSPDVLTIGRVRSRALWADASTIVIATMEMQNEGYVYLISSEGTPALQTGLPVVGFTAAWGFGSKDIWVGSSDSRLYHYDGTDWSLKASFSDDGGWGIIKLWGSAGSLFVVTGTEFAQWDGTQVNTLESLSGSLYYKDLWGNSAKEVFVTLVNYEEGEHGTFEARWFNGSVVSQF